MRIINGSEYLTLFRADDLRLQIHGRYVFFTVSLLDSKISINLFTVYVTMLSIARNIRRRSFGSLNNELERIANGAFAIQPEILTRNLPEVWNNAVFRAVDVPAYLNWVTLKHNSQEFPA
jgi:hypothetical protein